MLTLCQIWHLIASRIHFLKSYSPTLIHAFSLERTIRWRSSALLFKIRLWIISLKMLLHHRQGLKQKEKADIVGEKNAKIGIVAIKTVTQRWLQVMLMEPKQATHCNYFNVFSLLCSYYVIDMIKKLELGLLVVIILFKIEFGYAQISVSEIGTPMSKTACINPWSTSPLTTYGVLSSA